MCLLALAACAREGAVVSSSALVATEEGVLAHDGPSSSVLGYGHVTVDITSSGDRVIVGTAGWDPSYGPDDDGDVRVFRRDGSTWTQEQHLSVVTSTLGADDGVGVGVAIAGDGSRVAIGVPGEYGISGSVRIWGRSGTSWFQQVECTRHGSAQYYGRVLAMSGDGRFTAAGQPGFSTPRGTTGAVIVIEGTSCTFPDEGTVVAAPDGEAGDRLGLTVAISRDGTRLVAGATRDDVAGATDVGSVRVFTRAGATWTQEAMLTAPDGVAGDEFGLAVAVSRDGTRVVVGAPFDHAPLEDSGSVRVFARRADGTWGEEARLSPATPQASARFGSAVAISGDGSRVFVGAPWESTTGGIRTGGVHVFARTGSAWSDEGIEIGASPAINDRFGDSVATSLDGSRVAVGVSLDEYGATADVGSARVLLVATSPRGASCGSDVACASGYCVDGVCCASACGAGAVDDCQACSAALTGGLDGTCAPLAASVASGVICRDRGACDVVERCVAGSTVCPTDVVRAAGVTCRASVGVCDVAEVCDGTSGACPIDAFEDDATVCRAGGGRGLCDGPELCTGTSAACPPDTLSRSGTPCRESVGGCDGVEVCDGVSATCPGDALEPAGTVCRASVGTCDVAETCDGLSGACPADVVVAAETVCLPAIADNPCDVVDTCDGASGLCRARFASSTVVCRPSSGGSCDLDDHCAGSSASCRDEYLAGVICRPSEGACDRPEICSGASPSCPPDAYEAAGISCRSTSDPICDPEEVCAGVSPSCPADVTSCEAAPDAALDAAAGGDAGASIAEDAAPATDAAETIPPPASGCACAAARASDGTTWSGWLALALTAVAGWRRRRAARETGGRSSLRRLAGSLLMLAGAFALVGCGREERAEAVAQPLVSRLAFTARSPSTEYTWFDRLGTTVELAPDGSRLYVGGPSDAPLPGVDCTRCATDGDCGSRPGTVRVYLRAGDTWSLETILSPPGGLSNDAFGSSLSVSGDGAFVLVGAPQADMNPDPDLVSPVGRVDLFQRTAGAWSHVATAWGEGPPQSLGRVVAIDGTATRALVTSMRGVRVLRRSGSTWIEEQLLDTSFASLALSHDGTRAFLGVSGASVMGRTSAGELRVYLRTGTTWAREATIRAADPTTLDRLGAAISANASGDRIVAAAPGRDVAGLDDAGASLVFVRSGTVWSEEAQLEAATPTAGEALGTSVAMSSDGARVIVGSATAGADDAGRAHVYVRDGARWSLEEELAVAERARDDELGASVAIDDAGALVALGAPSAAAPGACGSSSRGGVAHVFALTPSDVGARCGAGGACVTGHCVDGFCCDAPCGDDSRADCMACAGAMTGLADGVCGAIDVAAASEIECRPAAGPCDVAEQCARGSAICPSDSFRSTSTVCRLGPMGTCDATETCSGVSAACPADDGSAAAAGTPCRAAADGCDAVETCDGTSVVCPADAVSPSGVTCRAASGPCDSPEVCDGFDPTCPGDAFEPSGVICRDSVSPCDLADACDGTGPSCPVDAVRSRGTLCSPRDETLPCDADDVCDGTSPACPPTFAGTTVVCRASSGGDCDVTDLCDGTSSACPETFLVGVACRPSRGGCDPEEACSGSDAVCPPDTVSSAGISCRASRDPSCDPEEVCDGASFECAADVDRCVPGVDAGAPDASAAPAVDAGTTPEPVQGCACATPRSGTTPSALGLLALAMGLVVGARRRSRGVVASTAAVLGGFALVPCAVGPEHPRSDVRELADVSVGGLRAHVVAIGREGDVVATTDGALRLEGERSFVDHGHGVREWWRAGAGLVRGRVIEHGADLAERIEGTGPLEVVVAIDARGRASTTRLLDADTIEVSDGAGRTIASYSHLVVTDAAGRTIPAHMTVREGDVVLRIDDEDALYPLVVDPVLAVQEASVVVAAGATGEQFGTSVACSSGGDTFVSGAREVDLPGLSDVGGAWVFVASGSTWSEQGSLRRASPVMYDRAGWTVDVSDDGSRAIVSGSIGAWIYRRDAGTWLLEQTLLLGSADITVAMAGDASRVVVGTETDRTGGIQAGAARVFLRTGTTWTEEAFLVARDAGAYDHFGSALAMDATGSRIAIGAFIDTVDDVYGAGSVRVFVRTGTSWSEEATLTRGAEPGFGFGHAVAIDADGAQVVVGHRSGGVGGLAHVFRRSGVAWADHSVLRAPAPAADDQFGWAVAISDDGRRVLVGSPTDDVGTSLPTDRGSAHLFVRAVEGWAHASTLVAPDSLRYDEFGSAVALDATGSRAFVGAEEDDVAGRVNQGSVRVFSLSLSQPGDRCATDDACSTGFCVDGVCCASACGGGADDCEACSATLTGGTDGACAPLSAAVASTIVCRASADDCDEPEVCSVGSRVCPLDAVRSAGVECRVGGVCGAPALCDGVGRACPPSAFAPPTQVCRPARSICDVAETCSGASTACPMDRVAASGLECRPSTGPCDGAESCDGTRPVCPGDRLQPAGAICRAAAGPCDAPELCNGTSQACGEDVLRAMGTVCAPAAPGATCDADDVCDGVSVVCAPRFTAAGLPCGPPILGDCDVQDLCSGTSAVCESLYLADVECRPARSVCDRAESCSGREPACPPDLVQPEGISCRPSTGAACDPEEVCDGRNAMCPSDIEECSPRPDAGAVDASVVETTDAAPAAADAAITPEPVVGCACRTSRGRPAGPSLALLLALALLRRRRRSPV